MERTQLTPELLADLVEWQSKGRRNVTIEFNQRNGGNTCKIWAYDFDLGAGVFVSCREDVPSTEVLLRKQQAEVEAQRLRLMKQLQSLEA